MRSKNKITLVVWHRRWVQKPIAIVMLLAFVAAVCLAAVSYFKKIENYEKSLELGSQLVATSLYSKDRKATELIMNNLMVLNNLDWVSVCQNSASVIFLSRGQYRDYSCELTNSIFHRLFLLKTAIPGLSDGYLVVRLKVFELLYPMAIGLIILLFFALMLRNLSKRIYQRLNKDLLEPIHNFVRVSSSDDPISTDHQIHEIETVHKKIVSAYQVQIEYSKSQALNSLASQVAHDIRSPLSVINMLVPTFDGEGQAGKAELLLQATQRISSIADDLLQRGRAEQVYKPLQPLSHIVRHVVDEKRLQLQHENSQIEIQVADQIVQQLSRTIADSDLMRIISNLLNNSIEAIEAGKQGCIKLNLYEEASRPVIQIHDNGKGISKDALDKIGSKGVSLGKASGNGLGIYHAKATLERVNGHVNIQSEVGVGTVVTLSL